MLTLFLNPYKMQFAIGLNSKSSRQHFGKMESADRLPADSYKDATVNGR